MAPVFSFIIQPFIAFVVPIEPSVPVSVMSQDEFHDLDRVVMGHVFAIHNQFGCLLDEGVYKAELAERCLRHGLDVRREVLIRVTHGDFVKDYFIDLLICLRMVLEAKTVKELCRVHHGQGVNYLLLAGTQHGSLVNFRSLRAVRRFLSTTLTHDTRRQFETTEMRWPEDSRFSDVRNCVIEFCHDVGLGLDLPLYREAIAHLTKGARQLVPIISGPKTIGHQEMLLFESDAALMITSLANLANYRNHLRRLITITPLSGIAWVNLNLGSIHFEYLKG